MGLGRRCAAAAVGWRAAKPVNAGAGAGFLAGDLAHGSRRCSDGRPRRGARARVAGGPLLDKQGGWEGFESAARAYEQRWEGFESAYLACSEERRAVIECLG